MNYMTINVKPFRSRQILSRQRVTSSELDEATHIRDAKEEAHVQKRKEKQEELARIEHARQAEEEQKMLKLEKKLEKKRQMRIQEAEEMEEHMREIAARNRYLALNKKALAEKTFQSQQDAKLRTAKERQTMRMPDEKVPIPLSKPKSGGDLVHLKELLGL
jgi:hypothetical protein